MKLQNNQLSLCLATLHTLPSTSGISRRQMTINENVLDVTTQAKITEIFREKF